MGGASRESGRRAFALALATLLALVAVWPPLALAANVPRGFDDALVATLNGAGPTALAWLPNGDLLVADQGGKLYRLPAPVGGAAPVVALDLTATTCTGGEEGLLGVAVDPDFTNNPFVYTYRTAKSGSECVNRVSRWTVTGGTTIEAGAEHALIDNIPTPSQYHKAGDLEFGRDGDLYVSVGDGECDLDDPSRCQDVNPNARRLDVLLGKILRVDRDGQPPADNPFMGAGTQPCATTGQSADGQPCQEIYATGLRNPFRIAFDPNAKNGRFYINDVGGSKWEEIDLGKAGADYGWNIREGFCPTGQSAHCHGTKTYQDPIFAYSHARTGCKAITGGAFVPNGNGWGPRYEGRYLYADYICGKIFLLGKRRHKAKGLSFATGANGIVDLRFSPDGTALYYTLLNGQIRKITHG